MFHHLRTKLTVLYVALFLAALAVIALAVYAATTRNVEHMVRDQLTVSGTVFDNLSQTRYRKLQDESDILARDFGFRAAVATGDRATVRSALDNLGARFGINLAFVVGADGRVTSQSERLDASLPPAVVAAVQSGDSVSGVFVLNGVAYETVSAPILTPAPAGWVVFATALGPDAMASLAKLSAIPLQAEVLHQTQGGWAPLDAARRPPISGSLQTLISRSLTAKTASAGKLAGPDGGSIALIRRLPVLDSAQPVLLLLRCPLAEALRPYGSLLLTIALIGFVGVLLLMVGSWLLAQTVTRPISALERAARGLQRGEAARVVVDTGDEIGRLGMVFNAMADEIEDREASLKAARDLAEAASQAKTTFLANMNHEVRTPLNGVLGVANLLAATRLDARQQEMVGVIEASGEALLRILNDVLDMVELSSGDLGLIKEAFDLEELVQALAATTASGAQAKGLTFHLVIPEAPISWMRGDRRRIDQVLSNLLSNAVKFTDRGGVTLSVGRSAASWWFEVRDTGVGFDPVNLEQMFQPFSQTDGSMTRRFGGTGLGLCLARDMARAMGGDVTADGAPGRGAAFTLTLPLAEAPAPAVVRVEPVYAEAPDEGVEEQPPIRVLLADDHPGNRQVIAMILDAVGVDLVSAENGVEAVEAFQTQAFDVVLMDLQMPVMDGYTAIRLIREHEAEAGMDRTPIVVISANIQTEHRRAAAEAGADSHLAKPILAPMLLAALEEALSAPGMQALAVG